MNPSTDQHEVPDDVGKLLADALRVPAPRQEFVAALAEQTQRELDATVASTGAHSPGRATVAVPRSGRRRWLAAWAIAASALAGMLVWSLQPAYSWAGMVRALEAQPWIEAQGQGMRGWFSALHRVAARRKGNDVVFDNLASRTRNRYRPDRRAVFQSTLAGDSRASAQDALLTFLLFGSPEEARDLGGRVEVVSQSWRKIESEAGPLVELKVELQSDHPDDTTRATFVLDPHTELPLICRLDRNGGQAGGEIELTYPAEGPRDVHAEVLGVPGDAPTVAEGEAVAAIVERPAPKALEEPKVQPAEPQDEPPTAVAPALAAEQMSARVDELLAACWQDHGIDSVGTADDAEFLRRVYLDLAGRVPTVTEAREFLADVRASRRVLLLDELLARYDHATHLAAVWRRFLLPDGVDLTAYGGPLEFERWLTKHFRANVPYDEVVRELLLAEGRVTENGPLMFYTALKMAPEELASQTARVFLGTRMECAQCHDHFFDDRWTQEDFWAYAAFFARISRPESKFEMVSPVMRVRDSRRGEVTLPDTDIVIGPKFPAGAPSDDAAGAAPRRQRLAQWITAPDNEHFARATVNRVWAHLFGRGLVDPVDDMRPDNPPICPEVLDALAANFVASGCDLRELFRALVLTDAYQLTSSSPEDDPARRLHFAQMNVKSLTAEQLYDCIAVATRLEPMAPSDGEAESVLRLGNMSRQAFLEQFRAPPGQVTEYHAGIPQALTLMNGRLIQNATQLATSGILRSLQAPFFSDEQRVETLFLATLSRRPSAEERATMLAHFASAPGEAEQQQALGDTLWVLLNCAEFTANH